MDRIVPEMLCKVKKHVQHYMDRECEKLDISWASGVYLMDVYKNGSVSKAEMSRNLGFNKANTTRIVDDLEIKGILKKNNGREYCLTDSGLKKAEEIEKIRIKFNKLLQSGLTEQEKIIFADIFEKMYKNLCELGVDNKC